MNLDKFFPLVSFTTTELNLIAVALTTPAVIKYFKSQQAEAFKAIANAQPSEGETDDSFLRRLAAVNGQLVVYEALLGIEPPPDDMRS